MENIKLFVQKHNKTSRFVLIGYLIFGGCFIFPLSSEEWLFNFEKAYMIIVNYGIVAILFVCLFSGNMTTSVYLISLLFTTVGMILRYILEFGEYSNIINFTKITIIMYIGIIPLFCTFIYWFICKLESKTKM